jgi:hypothetical protein
MLGLRLSADGAMVNRFCDSLDLLSQIPLISQERPSIFSGSGLLSLLAALMTVPFE